MIVRVDPLCHTLVGATLAQTGLRHRSSLAAATLIIGANLPDVDAITYFWGDSLYWRRGWTHGVLALVAWPFVLTGAMLLWHRGTRRWAGARARPPDAAALLALAALAVLTHPTLDWLNNYGVRWLMPIGDRWFYGDALFIVDPVMWLVLALGTLLSWRMRVRGSPPRSDIALNPGALRQPQPEGATPPASAAVFTGTANGRNRSAPPGRHAGFPARVAMGTVVAYALAMTALGIAGPPVVREQFARQHLTLARDPMVAPVLASLTRRYVVADGGDRYYVADFRWGLPPRLAPGPRVIPKNDAHPAVAHARVAPEARGFLEWTRFPFFTVADAGDRYLVTMDDARYAPASGVSWASVSVIVPKHVVHQPPRADGRWQARGLPARGGAAPRPGTTALETAFLLWCGGGIELAYPVASAW
jgi:inner membrane protein